MSENLNEMTNDILEDSIVESETEVQEDSIIEENKETNSVDDQEIINEEVKGENIYVENDIDGLERMLGIPSSEEDDVDNVVVDNEKEDLVDNVTDNIDSSDDSNLEESSELSDDIKPLRFSDFMDECKDDFTYLTHANGSFNIISLPIVARKEIKNAVKSPHYVFRYPKFTLRDPVLGFVECKTKDDIHVNYTVYFPDYSLTFSVPMEYSKPYSVSFKDYFEDLITRFRPDNMSLSHYTTSVIITSIKVIETGIIEVIEDGNTKQYMLNNDHINFYEVLAYIRELSDLGEDTLTLKLMPAYFSLL